MGTALQQLFNIYFNMANIGTRKLVTLNLCFLKKKLVKVKRRWPGHIARLDTRVWFKILTE